jgi:hypothetical protein
LKKSCFFCRRRKTLAAHSYVFVTTLSIFRRTGQTTLKNTEEYPPSAVGSSAVAGFDDVDGTSSYPALPLPARRTTLLPGQTYPEPLSSGSNILLAHSHTVSVLREAFSPPSAQSAAASRLSATAVYQPVPHLPHHHHHHHHNHHLHHHNHTFTVHARKVETTLGPQQPEGGGGGGGRNQTPGDSGGEPPPQRQLHHHQHNHLQEGEEVKPPLFPKQYYYSVKQRLGENSDSPAVPRKLKPTVSLSPSTSASHSPGQGSGSLRAPSPHSFNNESNSSFETGGGGGHNCSDVAGHPPGFQPYRETTKPFEMADFYK